MSDYFKRVFSQISQFLKEQPPAKLAGMLVVGAVIVVAMASMFFWAGDKTFSPLMTNLTPEDSTNIIRLLREKRIPFRVDTSGRNISVPPESLYDLRLELATLGMGQSSLVGYELFDKQNFSTPSFVQKINQKRALEGELMRTINTIRGVRHSRVHLAIPAKSTFVEDSKKSTASVVLDLDPGTQLAEKQVYGIGNLVARAVEGMEVADVVIVDSQGRTISKNSSDPLAAATANQLDFRQKVEGDLEKRVESILTPVVGEGKVTAKVSADLDFSQVNETQTLYDADGTAVYSTEKRNDNMNMNRPGPYGPAGALSNTPGQPPAANGDIKNETIKSNEVTNYNVPQTVRRTTKQVGAIKRLSVAVVLDGKPLRVPGKDGHTQAKTEAWSAEKLKEFEDLVSSAVGIEKKRGDILEIRNIDFTHEDFDEVQRVMDEKDHQAYMKSIAINGVIALGILMFSLFVVRPFIKWLTENTVDNVDTFLPQTIEELERMQKNSTLPGLEDSTPVLPDRMDPEKVEGEMIKEKIVTLVDANPHKAALILKDWLHVDTKKKPGDKDEPALLGGKGKAASATA